jgi:thiol-disulfide isomerase/thioredoxin
MKANLLFILFLLLTACSNSPTNLKVDLKSAEGYGVFKPGNRILFPINDSVYYQNVPNSVSEFVVRSLVLQRDQYYWNRYQNNQIDKSTFCELIGYYHIDTTKLTDAVVDCEILILIGDKNNKRIIIVDSDNDEDFSDENINEYDYPLPLEKQKEIAHNLPVILTKYEYYENGKVQEKSVKMMPSPYKGSLSINYNTDNEVEKKYYLFISFPEHKQGVISLNKNKCVVLASNYFSSNIYETNRTMLFVFPRTDSQPSELKGDIPLGIGDIFNVRGSDYVIDSIDKWGESLFLEYIGENAHPYGVTEGYFVPRFDAYYLDQSVFTFEDYRGKYVLFDFWGTWCNPCLKLIPELKTINDDYKDKNFALISVAFDNDPKNVLDFVNENKMNWDHLFVSQSQIEKNSIVQKLKISSFPSTLLISPDREIIARNKPIAELRKMLNQELNAL